MSSQTPDSFRIIACRVCGVKNRIPEDKISLGPKCGKCKAHLTGGDGSDARTKSASQGHATSGSSDIRPSTQKDGKNYRVGDLIASRYHIHDILGGEGKSAMGVVYVCHDYEHDLVLALKTLQRRFLDSKKVMDSFKKEALAWIHLEKHPYIVRAYWCRDLEGHMYIGSEYISPDSAGRNSLTHYMKGDFSLKRTLTWAIQFCYGMDYACSKGVTPHRDIKPDNILITVNGDVKITDFGLVGLWDKTDKPDEIEGLLRKNRKGLTFLTTHNNRIVAGSPPWMAPEQFFGVAKTECDIYGFGVVLYQMVNDGELPYKPKKGDSWGVAHKTYPIPSVPSRGRVLEPVIHKCLQKRRDKRYPDFASLQEDLQLIFKKEITRKTGEKPPAPPVLEELSDYELINKGISLANLGLIDEAIRHYMDCIEKDANNAPVHYNFGNALLQKGRFDEAVREFKTALGIDPSLAPAYYNLGMAFLKTGRPAEAIKAYESMLGFVPDSAQAYLTLGVAHGMAGNPDRQMDAYRQAIRCKPDYAEAHFKIGIALFNRGMLDDAVAELMNAARFKPGYSDAYYAIAAAFMKKGLYVEALRAYEEFLRCASPGDGRTAKAEEIAAKLRQRRPV